MSKPHVHAQSSARQYGGKPEDYLDIHNWFDETKVIMADARHRALRHHAEGIFLCERIFGFTRVNSAGQTYSVRDIGEQHVLEDFQGRFIPSAQDYLQEMSIQDWMINGRGSPPSFAKINEHRVRKQPKSPAADVVYDGTRTPGSTADMVLDGRGPRVPEGYTPFQFTREDEQLDPPPAGTEYVRDVDGVARGVRPLNLPAGLIVKPPSDEPIFLDGVSKPDPLVD